MNRMVDRDQVCEVESSSGQEGSSCCPDGGKQRTSEGTYGVQRRGLPGEAVSIRCVFLVAPLSVLFSAERIQRGLSDQATGTHVREKVVTALRVFCLCCTL